MDKYYHELRETELGITLLPISERTLCKQLNIINSSRITQLKMNSKGSRLCLACCDDHSMQNIVHQYLPLITFTASSNLLYDTYGTV